MEELTHEILTALIGPLELQLTTAIQPTFVTHLMHRVQWDLTTAWID